jgi:hypothetical protein
MSHTKFARLIFLCGLVAVMAAVSIPAGVARVFVSDSSDDVFRKWNEGITANTAQALANGNASDICVDDTHVYVLENPFIGNRVVHRYTGYNTNVSTVSRVLRDTDGTALGASTAMVIDGDDLYVADDGNNEVLRYSLATAMGAGGNYSAIDSFPFAGGNAQAQGMAVDDTYIYIADAEDGIIYRYLKSAPGTPDASSELRSAADISLVGNFLIGFIQGIAVEDGALYVAFDVTFIDDNVVIYNDIDALYANPGTPILANSDNPLDAASDNSTGVGVNPAPSVVSIVPTGANPSGAASVTFLVTFSEAVTGVGVADFAVTLTGTLAGVTVTSTGADTGNTRTVTVNTGTGSGTIRLDFLDDNTVVDIGAVPTGGAFNTGGVHTIDHDPPTVAIGAPSVTDTNTGPVDFGVTYTGATAINLTPGDVTLNTTGSANGTIGVLNGTTATPTVQITAITGDGTIGITIAAGTSQDGASNTDTGAGPSATFNVDNTAPTVGIGAPSVTDTNTGPVDFGVTYTGATAINLTPGDITLNTTGSANGTIGVLNGTTATPTVQITAITGDGTIGITIAGGVATDAAGNADAGAGPSTTFVVDNTGPSAGIGAPSAALAMGGPIDYAVTYAGATSINLTPGDVSLNTTGSATGTIGVLNGTTSTPTVQISAITGDGTIGITLAGGVASDGVNTDAGAGPSTTFTVDNTDPNTTAITPSTAGPVNSAAMVSSEVTFDEDVINFVPGDVIINHVGTAGGNVAVSGTGTSWTVGIDGVTGDGFYTIQIMTGVGVEDLAGNGLGSSTTGASVEIDNTPPVVFMIAPLDLAVIDIEFLDASAMGAGVLDPANYTITGAGQGTLAANPDSVVHVSGNTYQLTWSAGQSIFGQLISIEVSDTVEDAAGNAIIPTSGDSASSFAVPAQLTLFSTN